MDLPVAPAMEGRLRRVRWVCSWQKGVISTGMALPRPKTQHDTEGRMRACG